MMSIALIARVPPRLPSIIQHTHSLHLRRSADKLAAITGAVVLATRQEEYGVADAMLVDERNHERVQSLEAIV